MRVLTSYTIAFFGSVLVAYTCASVFHSAFTVQKLMAIGIDISLAEQLGLGLDDWIGLAPRYGVAIAAALLIGYAVASAIYSLLKRWKYGLYTAAGGTAFLVMLLAMGPLLNVTIIAGAREYGLYGQILAGCIGGYFFAYSLPGKTKR